MNEKVLLNHKGEILVNRYSAEGYNVSVYQIDLPPQERKVEDLKIVQEIKACVQVMNITNQTDK